ncbi:uncharacterized protein LOC112600144 [Melanaphis sacchari]|uniref:uncharacterized protein LOC112600144 n=1 Tax=Melanaphis sacchari TaxID=742174 RepID=UPI000DC12E24|nr:uncharacterized protein LOC112600144 [Melanaphis sacchari]
MLAAAPDYFYDTYAAADGKFMFNFVLLYHSTIPVALVDGITVMKSRKLSFAIFVALSLQTIRVDTQNLPCSVCPKAISAININNTITDINKIFNDDTSLSQEQQQEIAAGSLDPFQDSKSGLPEGRGKKKKKIKKSSMNMMLGGSIMATFVVIFFFLNMITVTLGKALFFTFIAKFLVSVNWKSSEPSSKKKSSHNEITVLMT